MTLPQRRHFVLVGFAACLAWSPAAAQQLQLRGGVTVPAVPLAPSLGINADSLRTRGRGLQFVDIQLGTGDTVRAGDEVQVHYVGFLADGTKFAATDRTPFTFRVGDGNVIEGWVDGVMGMRVGGRRQLVIPPFLAYGREGKGTIPPDATLVFDLTLVERRR